MARDKTYFISDLHLGAKYDGGSRDREKLAVSFLRSIKDDASTLYLVGDILDYWYEYRTVVPRGYVRFFGALSELADAGVRIVWLIGNHDIWLFDYLRDEIGIEVVDGAIRETIDGRVFYITHGDGVGHLKRGFRFIRALFRSRFCQALFASVHPRWTVPFAHRWSAHSRVNDTEPRFAQPDEDPLVIFAKEALVADPEINYFVFGHRHVELHEKIARHSEVIILGDWLKSFTYGIFDKSGFRLKNYDKTGQKE